MNEANAVDVAGIDRQLADIDAQEKRINAKLKRLRDGIAKAEHEQNELWNRRERLQLCRLVGRPVKQKEKWGGTPHKTDTLTGILLKVNRRKALVDYGDAGKWSVPIDWLQPVDGDWTEHGAILSV